MIKISLTKNLLKPLVSISNSLITAPNLLERPKISSSSITVIAGKMKSRKAVSKRFRATGAGRIIRSQGGKKHLNEKKTSVRKNNLSSYKILVKTNVKNVFICLPYL